MTAKPLPCAHCGGEAELRQFGNEHTKRRGFTIKCGGCRIELTNAVIRQSLEWCREQTIEAWNRRALPSDSAAPSGTDIGRVRYLVGQLATTACERKECEAMGCLNRRELDALLTKMEGSAALSTGEDTPNQGFVVLDSVGRVRKPFTVREIADRECADLNAQATADNFGSEAQGAPYTVCAATLCVHRSATGALEQGKDHG